MNNTATSELHEVCEVAFCKSWSSSANPHCADTQFDNLATLIEDSLLKSHFLDLKNPTIIKGDMAKMCQKAQPTRVLHLHT